MKVVLASFDQLGTGKGASAHILANAAILSERHDVAVVSLGKEPVPGLRHRPIYLPEPNWLRRALLFQSRVQQVFDEYEFDVYHVRSPWEGLATPPGARVLYEINALYSIEAQYHFPAMIGQPRLRERLRLLERCLFDRARLLVTPSPTTARYLQDLGVDRARMVVIPNAPAVDVQPVDRPERDELRLCYIGTVAPWQGLPELISILPRIDRPFRLTVLTGAGRWQVKQLLKQASKRGLGDRIEVRPPLPADRLGPFLATQDIGLAPLIPCERNLVQGCMPIKILDYAAAGLPVLAPDMPVVTDILGQDYPCYRRWGRTGMTATLAELMRSASLRRVLAHQGQERVLARFSKNAQSERLHAAYARLEA